MAGEYQGDRVGAKLVYSLFFINSLIALNSTSLDTMIGQKSIRNFFCPVDKKRIIEEYQDNDENARNNVSFLLATASAPHYALISLN